MAATTLNLTSGVVYLRGGNAFSGVLTSTTGILNIGDGTVTAPAYSFAAQTGAGLYRSGSSVLDWAIPSYSTTNSAIRFSNAGVNVGSGLGFGFVTSGGAAGTVTTLLQSLATTTLNFGNVAGTTGIRLDYATDGTLKVRGAAGTAASGNIDIGAKLTAYNNQTTAGWGLPAILGETISATLTANTTVLTVTPASTAARYKIDGCVTSTSGTNTGTVQITVDYVDSQGTVHTGDIIFLAGANAAGAATQTGASKEWHLVPWEITTNNAGTNILVKLVVTGTVAATVAVSCERVG